MQELSVELQSSIHNIISGMLKEKKFIMHGIIIMCLEGDCTFLYQSNKGGYHWVEEL